MNGKRRRDMPSAPAFALVVIIGRLLMKRPSASRHKHSPLWALNVLAGMKASQTSQLLKTSASGAMAPAILVLLANIAVATAPGRRLPIVTSSTGQDPIAHIGRLLAHSDVSRPRPKNANGAPRAFIRVVIRSLSSSVRTLVLRFTNPKFNVTAWASKRLASSVIKSSQRSAPMLLSTALGHVRTLVGVF